MIKTILPLHARSQGRPFILCTFSTFPTSSKSIWNGFFFRALGFSWQAFYSLLSNTLFYLPHSHFLFVVVITLAALQLCLLQPSKAKTEYMIYFSIHIAVQRDRLVNHYIRKVCVCVCSRAYVYKYVVFVLR